MAGLAYHSADILNQRIVFCLLFVAAKTIGIKFIHCKHPLKKMIKIVTHKKQGDEFFFAIFSRQSGQKNFLT